MAEINTRIILRNDTAENWENSEVKLKKGESAVEIIDGKAKLKIATADDQTFASAAYVGGAEANVFQVTLAKDATDIEAAIAAVVGDAELAVGDIAIVKATIGDTDKISYTSYVYDKVGVDEQGKDRFAWTAMDGNYSASNVYTNDNITLAGTYSTIGNFSKGKVVSAGTSLQSLLTEMLSQRIQPGDPTAPTATITATGDDGGKEVGDTYTKPTATITVTTGSYTNEGTSTGVKYLANNVTVAYGADPDTATYKVTNSAELGNNGTVSIAASTYAPGATSASYTDNSVSYTFSGKAHNEAGNVAKDNLGANSNPEKKIAAGDLTVADKSVSFRGYRKMFVGNTTATTLDSTAIRALSLKNAKASTTQFEVTVPEGATNLVIACPTKSVGKKYTLSNVQMFSAGVWDDYTSKFEQQNTADSAITVDGKVTGQDAQIYNVYMWKFAALKGDTKFKITLASANA